MLKILTYNVREDCRNGFGLVVEVLREARADAVAVMELASDGTARRLGSRLDMGAVFGEGNCDWHVAWLTSLPIVRWTNHRDPRFAKTLLEIEVEWGSLFATHLASRHETWTHSWEEIPVILDILRATAEPHILVGDLNAFAEGDEIGCPPPGVIPRTEVLQGPARRAFVPLSDAGYVDCYRRCHPHEPGFTYPTDGPWLRLDFVFASPEAGQLLTGADVVDDSRAQTASDHLPVWATFEQASGR